MIYFIEKYGGEKMQDIIEVYDNYHKLGIKNRIITEGREIELVREYIDYRKEIFEPSTEKKLAVFLEAQVSNSYPDIVFVEYNPENYIDWNTIRTNLKKDDLKILYHIYFMGGLEATDITMQLGVTWKDAFLSIERLYDSKLIKRDNHKWGLIDDKKITTHKIEAVEAKINQWDQVLQQSIINRNFASESYALSVSKSKPRKEVLTKFKKFGVGVCLKNGNSFDVIKEAKKTEIPVSFNSILFNEWIGRILNLGEEVVNAI